MANISFTSFFNPERSIHSRHIEAGLINPENNLERLNANQNKQQFGKIGTEPIELYQFGKVGIAEPVDFTQCNPSEVLGRSQVTKSDIKSPHKLELSDEDAKSLLKLTSNTYGFYPNGNEFWFHTRKPNRSVGFPTIMGDGRLQGDETRQNFVKHLINDDIQAFQIAGKDRFDENKLITVVRNEKEDTLTIYTCDSEECFSAALDTNIENKELASIIIDQLETIQGVTTWNK